MTLHGGQRYTYQILTAVAYTLEKKFDQVAIEGADFEDSVFLLGNKRAAIGEAKTTAGEHWTIGALFGSGNHRGPLLQLWDRWSGTENLVLFSTIPPQKSIRRDEGVNIPDAELSKVVSDVRSRVQADALRLKSPIPFDVTHVKDFLARLTFRFLPDASVNERIIRLARQHCNTNIERIDRITGYVNSTAYRAGEPIDRDLLVAFLCGSDNASQAYLIAKLRSDIHAEIHSSFHGRGWSADYNYELELLSDFDTVQNSRWPFECLVTRKPTVPTSSTDFHIEYYVPIRTAIMPSLTGQNLVFSVDGISKDNWPPPRWVLLEGIKRDGETGKTLLSLFLEYAEAIPFSRVVKGFPVLAFNAAVKELHDDYTFLCKGLARQEVVGQRMARMMGHGNSHVAAFLFPLLLTDHPMTTEAGDTIEHVLYSYQDHCFHVVSRTAVGQIARKIDDELRRIMEWLPSHVK